MARPSRGKTAAGGGNPKAGRRPGATQTRDAILQVARRRFAESGYDRPTIRAIAAEAGVAPGLVRHFFGSKQRLFALAVQTQPDPAQIAATLTAGDPAEAGTRVARFILRMLDPAAGSQIVAVLRAAASEPAAALLLRDRLSNEILGPVAAALGVGQSRLRADLVATQILGLAATRDIIGLPALTALDHEQLAAAIAPALQHFLTGDLPPPHDRTG
jgi:AcrR family transcriptional regulator